MVEGFGGKGWGRDVELKASCEMCLRIMQMQTIFFFFFFELWSYSSDTRRIDELGTQIIVELGIWTPTTVSFRYGEKRRENSRFPSLRTGAYILP